jgi:flagellar basal-body rod modification protein FlgD
MATTAIPTYQSAGTSGALTAPAASSADSEQRFLKLLVTQLNNQDPLNPLDNAQLTSQLAQMSTVSGIEKLNSAFQSLLTQSGSSQVLQSAALIGRTVLVPGSELVLDQDADMPFAVEMPAAADSVKVTIANAAGEVVRSYDLGALPQGVKTLSWDGRNDSGEQLADGGVYTLKVEALSGGSQAAAGTLTYAKVASVAQGAHGVSLDLNSGKKSDLGEVRLIL